MNIVFIQIRWPLQECLINLLGGIHSQGHNITVIYDSDSLFVDESRMNQVPASFIKLSNDFAPHPNSFFAFLIQKIRNLFHGRPHELISRLYYYIFKRRNYDYGIHDFVDFRFSQIRKALLNTNSNPCLVIGVEQYGLLVAAKVANLLDIPLCYYSLELNYYYNHTSSQRWHLNNYEYAVSSQINHVIVQDSDRLRILQQELSLPTSTSSLIPVGADPRFSSTHDRGHNSVHTQPSHSCLPQVKLLYVGGTHKVCLLDEFLNAFINAPKNFYLHLHIWGSRNDVFRLTELGSTNKNVSFSTHLMATELMHDLIADSDIGVAFYNSIDPNWELTSKSSQKIADYLMHGKPILTLPSNSISKLYENFMCGKVVDPCMNNLVATVNEITSRYESYSVYARKAYDSIYNSQSNGVRLGQDLSLLSPKF